jgi:type IV pilus biogenesis protein CpaD/CtpE
VLKAKTASVLAFAVLMTLQGCSKEQPSAQAPAAPAAAPQMDGVHPLPSSEAGAAIDLAGIAKADGGKTVAELYAEKTALADTRISLRGKVVKANSGIMNKDWLHIRDGSGADGTNDLTVTTTTKQLPKVGDTVVVTGKVTLNKDFGMGYQYPVILEDADVTIESSGAM